MDWLTFIAAMTRALAWPLAVAWILISYRRTLLDLAARISALKYGTFEATFDSQQVRTAAVTVPAPTGVSLLPDDLSISAELNPPGAIARAWTAVEESLMQLLAKVDASWKDKTPFKSLSVLRSKGILSEKELQSLSGLMTLRNLAAHASGREVTAQQAREFISLANAVLYILSTKESK